MGKAGSPVCRYGGSKYYIWLDAEERDESNDTNIVFIALSMRKLLTRSVHPTHCEQTIVVNDDEEEAVDSDELVLYRSFQKAVTLIILARL